MPFAHGSCLKFYGQLARKELPLETARLRVSRHAAECTCSCRWCEELRALNQKPKEHKK